MSPEDAASLILAAVTALALPPVGYVIHRLHREVDELRRAQHEHGNALVRLEDRLADLEEKRP